MNQRRLPETDSTAIREGVDRVLVLACGALARELKAVSSLHQLGNVTIECLPGEYHMRPEKIVPALQARLDDESRSAHDRVLIGYGDCGTGGALDRFCAERGLERLPGDHCYQFFAGHDRFLRFHDAEPGTFYLTDYLARHFDRFVVEPLGLRAHPELTELYFGNYSKLVFLAQVPDQATEAKARDAARFLDLDFEMVHTGYGELETKVVNVALGPRPVSTAAPGPVKEPS